MPINRELRREYADQLASFLRGEMDSEALFDGYRNIISRNRDPRDDAIDGSLAFWIPKNAAPHTVSASRDTWEWMRRALAMLESNLDIESWPTGHRATLGIRGGLGIGCVLLALAYMTYLLFGLSLTLFCTLWISTGILGFLIEHFYGIREPERPFQPFDNEAQWLVHEPLLARFNLPVYDPAVHHRRAPSGLSWWKWIVIGLATASSVILLAILWLIFAPFQIPLLFRPVSHTVRRVTDGDAPAQL